MPYKLDLDFNRSVVGLNLSAERSGVFTLDVASIELNEGALQRFNSVATALVPEFTPITMDQFAGACRRALRAAAAGAQSPFIRVRLRRAAELRGALADPAWNMSPELRVRIADLVAYMDDVGLIANDVPVIGRLDEALLIDVAMDALRAELDDYAAFCRYRDNEAAHSGTAASAITRAQWQEEREAEFKLEHLLKRTRGSSYGAGGMEQAFRVC